MAKVLLALAFEAEEVLQEQEMPCRRHRQELGPALEDAEGHRLEQLVPRHREPLALRPAASRIANWVVEFGLLCRRGFYTACARGAIRAQKLFPMVTRR